MNPSWRYTTSGTITTGTRHRHVGLGGHVNILKGATTAGGHVLVGMYRSVGGKLVLLLLLLLVVLLLFVEKGEGYWWGSAPPIQAE